VPPPWVLPAAPWDVATCAPPRPASNGWSSRTRPSARPIGAVSRARGASASAISSNFSISWRLLLDSRVVDLTMSYNPLFVTVVSLKPLFFNGLKKWLRFVEHMEA
jgi:hypothetical protein